MRVLVMRHGEAVDGRSMADANRYLTVRGRAVAAGIATDLRDRGISPDRIFVSPLVRAVQTAEVVASVLSHAGPLVTHPPLAPGGSASAVLSVLTPVDPDEVVLFVSHEPTVRTVSSALVGGSYPPFRTAAVAIFEGAGGVFTLVEHLEPG